MRVNRLDRYGKQINSHDLIKLMALTLMIIDHIGQFLFPEIIWFRLLGRGAMPLFFFLIGFHEKLHISVSLVLYGIILSGSNWLLHHTLYFNILINFVLSYLILHYLTRVERPSWMIFMVFMIATALNFFLYPRIEYGTLGLMFMLSASLLHRQVAYGIFYLIFSLTIYFFWESMIFNFFTPQTILIAFISLLALLFYLMLAYRLKVYDTPPGLSFVIRVLSRYSLEIYFFHLLFFHCLRQFKII